MSNIFISYRREDASDVTGRVTDRLRENYGRTAIFTDVDSIPLGSDFRKILDEKVGKCEVLLAVIGKDWLGARNSKGDLRLNDPDDFVRFEIETALKRDIPVIPLLAQGVAMPTVDELPESLGELSFRNAIAIRPDPDFHNDLDRLIENLDSHFESNVAEEGSNSAADLTQSTIDRNSAERFSSVSRIAVASGVFLLLFLVIFGLMYFLGLIGSTEIPKNSNAKTLVADARQSPDAEKGKASKATDDGDKPEDSGNPTFPQTDEVQGTTPITRLNQNAADKKTKTGRSDTTVEITLPDGTRTAFAVSGDNKTTVTIQAGEVKLNTCPPGRTCASPNDLYPESAYVRIAGSVIPGEKRLVGEDRVFDFQSTPCGKKATFTFNYVSQSWKVVKPIVKSVFIDCGNPSITLDFPKKIDLKDWPTPVPPEVTAIEFSRTEVSKPCASGRRPKENGFCDDDPIVEVRVTATNPANYFLEYDYQPSGGRIVGQGANVIWDLSGVQPGEYTLTVSADDGTILQGPAKSMTKGIVVLECECVDDMN